MPSYRRHLLLPAWGLYKGDMPHEKLIGTIRAEDIYRARDRFKRAGLQGDRIRRV